MAQEILKLEYSKKKNSSAQKAELAVFKKDPSWSPVKLKIWIHCTILGLFQLDKGSQALPLPTVLQFTKKQQLNLKNTTWLIVKTNVCISIQALTFFFNYACV